MLSIMAVIVVAGGFTAYWRYAVSETWFKQSLTEMSAKGGELDSEGCVSAVLDWHAACEANKPLCDHGVPLAMTHCLLERDRTDVCDSLDMSSAKAQWVFKSCLDRGTPCRHRKKCACADAYRALDSFCRHGQEGVSL